MEFFNKIKGGIYNGIGFVLVLGVTGVAYGAYVSMTDVNSGDTLTSSTFNQVLENIRVLRTDVDNIPAGPQGATGPQGPAGADATAPTGSVMAFNLSSCPTGWIIADGNNGTPDLRGEFIRGLDNGRGVDTGRTLATLQRGSLVMNTINHGDARVFSLLNSNDLGYDPALTNSSQTYGRRDNPASGGGAPGTWGGPGYVDNNFVKMTRPRNVALLYCIKQ